MLDMKFVRENLDAVRTMLKNRCNALDLSSFTELDERRRAILQDVEEKKARRNAVSKEIGVRKKAGESADAAVAEMRALGDEIAALDEDLRDVELKLRELLLQIPNMPRCAAGARRARLISSRRRIGTSGKNLACLMRSARPR